MDDRGTRLVGLILLGVMGFSSLVAVTICAIAHVEVPPSVIAIGATAAGAIAAFVPPAQSARLEKMEDYMHERTHSLLNAMNTSSLKQERMLVMNEGMLKIMDKLLEKMATPPPTANTEISIQEPRP